MRRLQLLLALALAATGLAAAASAAPADAALKRCDRVKERVGGAPVTYVASKVRLTRGFRCRDARRDIRNWIASGAYADSKRAMPPWTCSFGARAKCRLRTSFGGTKPLRTYRLHFSLRN